MLITHFASAQGCTTRTCSVWRTAKSCTLAPSSWQTTSDASGCGEGWGLVFGDSMFYRCFFFGGGNQDLSGPCHPNWKCSWIVSHAFECSPCPHHYHYHYGWFSGTFHAKSMGELCPMILWLMWVGNLQKHGDWCKQERVYTHRLPGVAIHHYLGEAPNYIMNQGFIN